MNLGGWEALGWALFAVGIVMLLLAVWVAVRRYNRLQMRSQLGGTIGPAEVRAPAAGPLDGDESSSRNAAADPVSEAVIYGLAHQLATAVNKLDEHTRAEAGREAETAATKIRADAEVAARWHVLEPARAEAKARSNATVAEGQREVQRIEANAVEEAQGTIDSAQRTADRLWSDTGDRMRRLTAGLSSAAANIESLKAAAAYE